VSSESRTKFGYVPALDGLRAIAVIAVVCFHSDLAFASGGFIGVSVFFTLSGFLITSLLIAEHNNSGRISLKGFYSRRLRRLLPASLVCIGLVMAAVPFWSESQRRRLPGDALAALANVANWRSAFSSVSYRDLFDSAPSPFAHFWSLAIEEQCYLVLPIIVVLALRRGRSLLAAAGFTLLALSIASALLTSDFDLAYNGTHVRIAEVLVGMLLSVLLTHRRPAGVAADAAATLGLALLLAATVLLQITDDWLAHGGLVVVALATSGVIIGAIGDGRIARVLGARPLVAIGKVSYGVYLFHWPIFLILSEDRIGWSRWPLMALRLGVLAVLTVVSFRVIERPIRSGHVLRRTSRAVAALATAVAALLAGIWLLPGPQLSATERLLRDAQGGPVTFTPAASTLPPEPPTVLVVGSDAAALALLDGLDATVVNRVQPTCPVRGGVELRMADGSTRSTALCPRSADTWLEAIDAVHPDLLVVSMGALDDGVLRAVDESGFPATDDLDANRAALARGRADLTRLFAQVATRSLPVLLYWPADPSAPSFPLSEFVLSAPGVEGVVAAPQELVGRVRSELAALQGTAVPRVLVLGDSTSLPFAAAVDRAAAGTMDVLWAGHEGCPFVRDTEYRASTSADQWFSEWFTPKDCGDFAVDVPALLASFHPDVVIVMANGTEVMQQRYLGAPAAYLPGSFGYQRYHDSEMVAFLAAIGPEGPPVMVADAPPVGAGSWALSGIIDPARAAGWNEQVERWVAHHPQVHLLRFADELVAFEAAHGSLREDGLHPEVGPLAEMVRADVLPQVRALAEANG